MQLGSRERTELSLIVRTGIVLDSPQLLLPAPASWQVAQKVVCIIGLGQETEAWEISSVI